VKFIHLSDLHLGKRVGEFSMLDDQVYILTQIIDMIAAEKPDGVIIAGDIYDKSVPSADAVHLADDFLFRLTELGTRVFAISGNHDSPERIAFASRMLGASGLHLSPVFDGSVSTITLSDEYGELDIFMLPFIKPAHVRRVYDDDSVESYTDAVRTAIAHMEIDPSRRNLLITHQFVIGAERSESEDISVGGSDGVDAGVFSPFDFVALGHIHRPQNITDRIRYCGTPLKYSFSEAGHTKSVTVLEFFEKGRTEVRTLPLKPLHDMRELRGEFAVLTAREFYENTAADDYLHITLTNEEEVPEALGRLRAIYPNIMKLDYDNSRTRAIPLAEDAVAAERISPLELFADFYAEQNGRPMTDEQYSIVTRLIGEIWDRD